VAYLWNFPSTVRAPGNSASSNFAFRSAVTAAVNCFVRFFDDERNQRQSCNTVEPPPAKDAGLDFMHAFFSPAMC